MERPEFAFGKEQRAVNFNTYKDSVLDLPLADVMRPEIALSLAHVMRIYTVGGFLRAWDNPNAQRHIEFLFETPEQAKNAARVCATWAGWIQTASAASFSGWIKAD